MGEPKKSLFKGLSSEYKKIIWPDKITIVKQTTAVALVSVILAAVIKVIDWIVQLGLDQFLIK